MSNKLRHNSAVNRSSSKCNRPAPALRSRGLLHVIAYSYSSGRDANVGCNRCDVLSYTETRPSSSHQKWMLDSTDTTAVICGIAIDTQQQPGRHIDDETRRPISNDVKCSCKWRATVAAAGSIFAFYVKAEVR
eukprot:scaffold233614_cov15-Prasinocladus_malaysianus.AAC.1